MNFTGNVGNRFVIIKSLAIFSIVGMLALTPGQVIGAQGYRFFSDGLDNATMETITLHRPGMDNEVVLTEAWSDPDVVNGYSREKQDISGDNVNANWGVSSQGGSPGDVIGGGASWNAHYYTDWAWAGEIAPGASVGDTVYLPSFNGTFEAGVDFGYFRITMIHDESGKQDLENPGNAAVLGANVTGGRTMSSSEADEVISWSLPWLTIWDLNRISGIADATVRTMQPSYSTHRLGSPEKVNINTASWEALRGIQIGSGEYMTDDLAKAVIARRSGVNQTTVNSQFPLGATDDYYPELSPEYVTTDGDTYATIAEACDHLEPLEANFECSVFDEYAMVGSEGLLWVEIRGGRVDSEGVAVSETNLQALIDRRPLAGGDPVGILYKRIR